LVEVEQVVEEAALATLPAPVVVATVVIPAVVVVAVVAAAVGTEVDLDAFARRHGEG
jgi:hypothetical protein